MVAGPLSGPPGSNGRALAWATRLDVAIGSPTTTCMRRSCLTNRMLSVLFEGGRWTCSANHFVTVELHDDHSCGQVVHRQEAGTIGRKPLHHDLSSIADRPHLELRAVAEPI